MVFVAVPAATSMVSTMEPLATSRIWMSPALPRIGAVLNVILRGTSMGIPPAPCAGKRVETDNVGSVTTNAADALVAEPPVLLTTTEYAPASAAWTGSSVKVAPSAPAMGAPFLSHW